MPLKRGALEWKCRDPNEALLRIGSTSYFRAACLVGNELPEYSELSAIGWEDFERKPLHFSLDLRSLLISELGPNLWNSASDCELEFLIS